MVSTLVSLGALGNTPAPAASAGPLCEAYGFGPQLVRESIFGSVCVAIVCEVLNVWVLPGMVAKYWPKGGPELTPKIKDDITGRALGTLHALLVLFGSIYTTFFDPAILNNPLSGVSLAWKTTGAIAAGYFLWDLSECLRKPAVYGVPFLLHAVLCLGAYAMTGWFNTYSWLGSFGLLYEASTPFMHVRTLLISLKRTDSPWFTVAQAGFALTYLFVRIGGGAYFAYTGLNLVRNEQCVAFWLQACATLIIVGTCSLNAFWFTLIIKAALKPRKEDKTKKEA